MNLDARAAFAEERDRFLAENPDIERVEALITDSSGIARGKWLPVSGLRDLERKGVSLPFSLLGENIWLLGVVDERLGLLPGDPDGRLFPVPGSLTRIPWVDRPSAQVLLAAFEPDGGTPCALDPRHALAAVQRRFADRGLTPDVAVELEFNLFRRDDPAVPRTRPPAASFGSRLYELDALADVQILLDEIASGAESMDVPLAGAVAELAPAQYEINLEHVPDACRAADFAVLLKRLVKRTAARRGFDATFMAKPYGDRPGNGAHIHASMQEVGGENAFDEPGAARDRAGPQLRAAVAGCLDSAAELQLVFAPHANSYRRFQAGSFAPFRNCWGYDHRSAAIRVSAAAGPDARFEHRIAGADAQPYLLVAAVLGGALAGMEERADPGPPVTGAEDAISERPLAKNWDEAIDRFAASPLAARLFGSTYRDLYASIKRSELAELRKRVSDVEFDTYYLRS